MYLKVNHVSKAYSLLRGGDLLAIKDISFEAGRRDFITILGPSGCGKSTLLLIVGGILPPTSGEVFFGDKNMKEKKVRVGFVFQVPVLFPWRKVLENVLFPLEIIGSKTEENKQIGLDLIKLVGLEGFEGVYPWELSGGMQSRVAICRALVHDPEVLLMDEPFGSLDALTRDKMNLELLRIWTEKRKIVLFVTHNIEEAIFLGDRVLLMSPRPCVIRKEFEVNLPRPRTADMKMSMEFIKIRREIQKFMLE